MRRTIEKLVKKRADQEKELFDGLDRMRNRNRDLDNRISELNLPSLLSDLEKHSEAAEPAVAAGRGKRACPYQLCLMLLRSLSGLLGLWLGLIKQSYGIVAENSGHCKVDGRLLWLQSLSPERLRW